ncbi:MAG: hypothetical protein AABY22_29225 [Nanoarchaeota archaeon]
MKNLTPEEKRIFNAIVNEGKNPEYHRLQIIKLKKEWPTLFWSIMNWIKSL